MVNAATQVKNNMGSGVEIFSYCKDKEKNMFQMKCFYVILHLSLQSTNSYRSQADKPK